jgi:uncharacterized protein YrrD
MRKANSLIGKELVNQATGEKLATVQDIILDNDAHQVVALLVDSGGWFRDARVVHWNAVVSIGDVVVVRGNTPIVVASSDPQLAFLIETKTPMTGTTIISDGGERIGTVGDLFINDAGAVVGYEISQGFISDLAGRKFLSAENIQAVGKDAIIAHPSDLMSVKEARQQQHTDEQQEQQVQQHAEPRTDTGGPKVY